MKENQDFSRPKMKVLLLGDINSTHLKKWILALASDYELGVFSFNSPDKTSSEQLKNLVIRLFCNENTKKSSKIGYFLQYFRLSSAVKEFKPDLIHAHYASSYGFIGALLNKKNLIVSAWGSDVFAFPKNSALQKWMIKFTFKRAALLMSTSNIMAREMKIYTSKKIVVTPFGVSTEHFFPAAKDGSDSKFVVGTVKSLEQVYGIDLLIRAFKLFHEAYPNSECLIYGRGSKLEEYQELVADLNLTKVVKFQGFVSHDQVPIALHKLDVFCALSRSESFGVAVLEASSCALPVIVSDIGGLKEVVDHNSTGFVIDNTNLQSICDKLLYFANNRSEGRTMGNSGRLWVEKHYSWTKSVGLMKIHYEELYKLIN